MARVQITAALPWDVEQVWRAVTDVSGYATWRSDLSRAEVLGETQFVEYARNGCPTTFTILASEPCRRWELAMENSSLKGRWTGSFSREKEGTAIQFTEDVTVKKCFLRPLVKRYLKKQQARFLADLRAALSQGI